MSFLVHVHPSHRVALRRTRNALLLLAALMVMAYAAFRLAPPYIIPDYLPLHTLVETFTVVVAVLVFSVGWNAYRRELPGNILLIACAFLGVALLDFSHMLSYTGMPDFVTPSGPEKAIAFWLAARWIAALTLLAVALLPWRPLRHRDQRYRELGATLALVATLHWIFLYHADWLPRLFVPGEGLTTFKVANEYAIIAVDLASAALLLRRMRRPLPYNAAGLLAVACTMAMSEFFFAQYVNFADVFNLTGHAYKVMSYLFLYFAVFVETIDHPYARLRESESQLQATLDAMPEVLLEVGRDGRIHYHHAAGTDGAAALPAQVAGKLLEDVLPPAAVEVVRFVLVRAERSGHSQGRQIELQLPEGRRWYELSAARKAVARGQEPRFIVLLHDITASKKAEEEVQHLAFFDHLTGLPNRRLLVDRLRQALAASGRSGVEGALLFIDLDNFKSLNDTLGHDFGDLLLQEVARRLRACVREGDTVARFGGDEFVVMLEGLSARQIEAAEQARAVCAQVLAGLNRPYALGPHEYRNTPSVGVTVFRSHQHPVEELLKQADIAMYQAKKSGRNTICFFDPQMQGAINSRAALESELRRALDEGQLLLHYQVQVDEQRRALGAEALIRWQHPQRGLVPPGQFIPLAEETGLVLPIGDWVLDSACAVLARWRRDPALAPLRLSVNISARQFHQDDFVDRVRAAVLRHDLDPRQLTLELTESMLLENIEEAVATMRALQQLGVRFSLDDFGTGYSSLQYLKRLPLNQLKIDQSFVRDLAQDEADRAIVATIITMARGFNLDVIAEGVETESQHHLLSERGCTRYQGYLFGRPVPIEQFEAALAPACAGLASA